MKLGFLLVGLFLASCNVDYSDIKKINRESIFHCNSSKIWVINKVRKKGVNHASLKLNEKDLIIFYENGKVLIQPMKTLGTYPNKTGTLKLSDDNLTCEFSFPKENWIFNTEKISAKLISLKALKTSDFPYDLEIISFPESENLKLD